MSSKPVYPVPTYLEDYEKLLPEVISGNSPNVHVRRTMGHMPIVFTSNGDRLYTTLAMSPDARYWDDFYEYLAGKIAANGLGAFSLDTETTGLNIFDPEFKLVGVVLGVGPHEAFYLPVEHLNPTRMDLDFSVFNNPREHLRGLLEKLMRKYTPVYHNAAYDRLVLNKTLGLDLDTTYGHDTGLMAHLVNENTPTNLKALAAEYLLLPDEVPELPKAAEIDEQLLDTVFEARTLYYDEGGNPTVKHGALVLATYWEALLSKLYRRYSNGALPYSFVMELTKRAYTKTFKNGQPLFAPSPSHGAVKALDPKVFNDFRFVSPELAVLYASDDAINTFRLYERFTLVDFDINPTLRDLYENLQLPVDDVMTRATWRGIKVDTEYLQKLHETLSRREQEFKTQALALAEELIPEERKDDFDLSTLMTSPLQLGTLLYDVLRFPVLERTGKGQPSVSKSALKKLLTASPVRPRGMDAAKAIELEEKAKEFIQKKLAFQEVAKLNSTYTLSLIEKADPNGRVHPSYKTNGTVSGRFSSYDPNWQNMPRLSPKEVASKPYLYGVDIRKAFKADEGYVFVSADYKAMEMVVAAAVSQDRNLTRLLKEGRDLHVYTAKTALKILHDETVKARGKWNLPPIDDILAWDDEKFAKELPTWRQDAKILNFSQLYRGTWYTLHKNFGFPKETAKLLERAFKEAYPDLDEMMAKTEKELLDKGYITYPEFGFIKRLKRPPEYLAFKDPKAYERQLAAALRTCLNALIQGYSAFIAKKAVVDTQKELENLGIDGQVMYQIHDDIGILVKEADALKAQEVLLKNMRRYVEGVYLDAEPEIKRTMSKAEAPLELTGPSGQDSKTSIPFDTDSFDIDLEDLFEVEE